jgi:hypothetical protein
VSVYAVPECPVHGTEMRVERGRSSEGTGRTGYCTTCAKHYALCNEVEYMRICTQLDGHEGPHADGTGMKWVCERVKRVLGE